MAGHVSIQLSTYLDGDLSAEERLAVEAHLETCEACRSELVDLREIVHRASALETVSPPRDLWPGIVARIEEPPDVIELKPRWSWTLMPQFAAAAMVALVLLTAVLWWAQSGSESGPDTVTRPAVQTVADAGSEPGLAEYAVAMKDLEDLIADNRERLDPETVAIIDRNLATVDSAVQEIVDALKNDPDSPYLIDRLAERRQQRLQLLRQATHVVQASL